MTTAAEAVSLAFWQARHTTAPAGWAHRYWESYRAPYRDRIIEAATRGVDDRPRHVLEVGANAGPNLRRLAALWPQAEFVALDCSAVALAECRAGAVAEGWGGRLTTLEGDLTALLPLLRTARYDPVLSVYTLAYVEPMSLPGVLADLRRLATGRVVLAEPMGETALLLDVTPIGWRHDYVGVLAAMGVPRSTYRLESLTGPDELNGLLTWEVA